LYAGDIPGKVGYAVARDASGIGGRENAGGIVRLFPGDSQGFQYMRDAPLQGGAGYTDHEYSLTTGFYLLKQTCNFQGRFPKNRSFRKALLLRVSLLSGKTGFSSNLAPSF
jgi:hypothetical protein